MGLPQKIQPPAVTDDPACRFYYTTVEAWDAMYEACSQAQTSIEFEQYILLDDDVGARFLDLFAAKAASGVKIRLLLDNIGSMGIESSPRLKKIIEAGGKVEFYNRMRIFNLFFPSTWYPRNHSKTMLIDDQVAFVGGVCLSEEMRTWHDLHMRLAGDVIQDIKAAFSGLPTRTTDKSFRYILSRPRLRHNPLYEELLLMTKQARSSIRMVSPYVILPWRLRRALYKAIARGVDVRIMLSEKTDVPLADYVTRSYFPKLLRKGVKFYLYTPTMLHAKYVVIDDAWATIGSTNMDYLSLQHNREANVIVRNRDSIATLRAHFDEDLDFCSPVTDEYCRTLPLYQRVIGWLGRPFKRVL